MSYLSIDGLKRGLGIAFGIVLLGIGFSACGQTTPPTTSPLVVPTTVLPVSTSPVALPGAQVEAARTPTLTSSDPYRAFTAADSFASAYAAAKAWQEEAQWYGIVPFTSITRFFALPLATDRPSWYFRFGASDGQEYLVEVLNGQVVGTNELVIPSYIEQPVQQLEPLGETWAVLDSEAVFAAYKEQNDSLLKKAPSLMLDYRLVKSSGQANPVWMLYNAQSIIQPIFLIDALTGEVLSAE
jgi:hypothetical protein